VQGRNLSQVGAVLNKALSQFPAYLLLSILAFLAVIPFVFLLLSAFKPYQELIDPFPTLFPKQWSVATFYEIFTRRGFPLAFWNTVWVAGSVTAIQGLTASAAGYVFAKYQFPGKELLFKILLATMMIPFAVVLIPLYVTIAQIHLVNNLWAIVVVALWNTFSLFTMRQFMESIPRELIEAARIDGAGEFWIYTRVVIPLALAPLTTVSVFTFLGQWDNFMFPSVVINELNKQTLPLFLNGLRSLYWTRYDLWITGSLLTVTPVLIAYAITQRTFVRGAQTSGLK
jgi:ABC-type glycerol-3-phosphate transport system permease component